VDLYWRRSFNAIASSRDIGLCETMLGTHQFSEEICSFA
jgi:hypothetical protein